LTGEALRRLRLLAQRLDGSGGSVSGVVTSLCGLQSQAPAQAALALRARIDGLDAGAVERARVEDRTVVRTWAMRGTMYLLPAADLGWLLPLTAEKAMPAAHRWLRRRGLDDHDRLMAATEEILDAEGPLTRADLTGRVGEATGLPVEGAAAGIVHLAALEGRICFGPDRGHIPTYVRLRRWLPALADEPEEPALTALVRRYRAGHGPVTPEDLASWSGLGLRAVRAAWEQGEPPDGRRTGDVPAVRLLPSWDEYVLAYADRHHAVAPEHRSRIFRAGQTRPMLLVDGLTAGTWTSRREGRRLTVDVQPFAPLASRTKTGVEQEVADIARFLGVGQGAVRLRFAEPLDTL
jgi:hypothetical protein